MKKLIEMVSALGLIIAFIGLVGTVGAYEVNNIGFGQTLGQIAGCFVVGGFAKKGLGA